MSFKDLKIAVPNPANDTYQLMSSAELDTHLEKKFNYFGINQVTSFAEDQINASAEKYYQILKKSSQIPRSFIEIAYQIYKKTLEDNPECQAFEGVDFTSVDTFHDTFSAYRHFTSDDVQKAFKELARDYPSMATIMMSNVIITMTNLYLDNLNQDRLNDFTNSTTRQAKSVSYPGSNFKYTSAINRIVMTLSLFANLDQFFMNFNQLKGL